MTVDDTVRDLAVSAIRLLGRYLAELPPEQAVDGWSRLESGDLGFRAVVDIAGDDVRVRGLAIDGSGGAHELFQIDFAAGSPTSRVQ